jgi:hypothetical protein
VTGGTLGTWLRAWRRQAARRRAAEGPWADLWASLGPLGVALAVAPLFRPVFLSYLALPPDRWPEGTAGVLERLSLVVGGWMALEAQQVILRTGDRAVLSPLPVAPAGVVAFELLRLAVRRWWLVPALAIALGPLLLADPAAWSAAVAVLFAVQLAGGMGGAVGALLAIEVSDAEAAVPLLDALRGQNPRAQAALLWAPGAVLAIVGCAAALAVPGAAALAAGAPVGLAGIAAPVVLAGLLAAALPRLARRAWFRGTPLLQEIDARYAAFEKPEDARRVYLDWAIRYFPAAIRTWALADLRHGWRARRGWITGAWLGAVAAAIAAWSADPRAIATSAAVAAVTTWGCGAISGRMDRDIPPFTRLILPDRTLARLAARGVVLACWLQPVAWLPALPVLVRHGAPAALGLVALTEGSVLAAAALGPLLGRIGLGLVGYAPAAALGAGLAAAVAGRVWVPR